MTFRPDARGSGRADERHLAQVMAEMRALADDFEFGILDRSRSDGKRWSVTAVQLMAMAKSPMRSTGGGGSGPHYAADGSRPGPTPGQALVPSEDRRRWDEWLTDVQTGLAHLRRANDILARATPAQQHPDHPEEGCRVCSRPGKPEPIYRAERCRWCYDFWILWKVDPPHSLLKLRRQGGRITENVIRKVLDEELAG